MSDSAGLSMLNVKVHDSRKKDLRNLAYLVCDQEKVSSLEKPETKKTWHVCKAASEQTTRL